MRRKKPNRIANGRPSNHEQNSGVETPSEPDTETLLAEDDAVTDDILAASDYEGRAASVASMNRLGLPEGGRMEAVVDLLFGDHLDKINASIRDLEKQLAERVNNLEVEMNVRIESLDSAAKAGMESLGQELAQERAAHDNSITKINGLQSDLEARIIGASHETAQLRADTELEVARMKDSLSTRAELSVLFAELGKRLESDHSREVAESCAG